MNDSFQKSKKKKSHTRSQFHLTPEQIKLLIRHAEKLRDKVIIKLLAYCGLRRFELAKIKIEDMDIETNKIRIFGKKNIERLATIFSEQLAEDLKIYIRHILNNPKQGYLFPAVSSLNEQGHISPTEINRIVAKAGHMAHLKNPIPELKNINPHILRHSCARILKDRGLSLEVIQKVLGHLSYQTTMDLYGTKSISEMDEELKDKVGDIFG
ncbi:MAG: tyrosine-type recombinase/integrase [Nanoarchaeota archaeon]|nr:tyrosine-type recombinase/integrase [Nanoarchaeota archaeon]MBU1005333.1 tyrosine-type recombinase/integrase [Nanoarchaeota archaeon]MBU1945495.1 tyrosine-type recombinase/integrase [Nanoarchaeota archaeon]